MAFCCYSKIIVSSKQDIHNCYDNGKLILNQNS